MSPIDNIKGTALVTGASSGIGAIYADRLAKRGHELILVARDVAKLTALADRIRTTTGRQVELIAADLTDKAELKRVEERLQSDEDISLLVNNAGVGATAALVDSDVDSLDRMIQLNVTALTRLTRAVAPGMVARGKGAVINIASIVASAMVMSAEEMVDASLAGFDQKELITIPSLPDASDWHRFDAARAALGPNLSRATAAPRYKA